jgi:hypothetical protein
MLKKNNIFMMREKIVVSDKAGTYTAIRIDLDKKIISDYF